MAFDVSLFRGGFSSFAVSSIMQVRVSKYVGDRRGMISFSVASASSVGQGADQRYTN